VTTLYLLYDAGCPLCSRFRDWLVSQALLVPVAAVPADSEQARQLFPSLEHDRTLQEVTVMADSGDVWTGEHAWVMCLWATAAHRGLAESLAGPAGLRVTRAMAYAAAGLRASLTSDVCTEAVRGGGYADVCDGACAHPV
jgi:predicted DCC family thiol-disulfide oxidoreductase YuxK